MQNIKKIAVVGLQRSGTNLLQTIITSGFREDISNFWKHSLREEVEDAALERSLVLMIVKHPAMWLQSCLAHRPEIFSRSRFPFLARVSREEGLAKIYSVFHRGWLDHLRSGQAVVVKYEDLLAGKDSELTRFLARWAWTLPEDAPQLKLNFKHIANSIEFSDEDREAYLKFRCAMDRELVERFWQGLDPFVVRALGYRLEDVTFGTAPTIRSVAYRLVQRAGPLSADEFQQIKQAAKDNFSNDGELLYQIGRRVASTGNYREALDWYLRALPAAEIHMTDFGSRTPMHMTYLDLLDDIAKTCSVLKAQKLKSIETFRKAERRKRGDLVPLAEAEWGALLSDIAQRQGKLSEAIKHARAAVAASPETRWYDYNLGVLLARAGQFEEAAKELRLAIEENPQDAVRHFALSDVLVHLGRIDEALVEAQAATTGERTEPWYFHHYGALLLKQGRLEEAAKSLREAITREPNDQRHHFLLSDVLARLGQMDEAIAEAEKATQGDLVEAWYFHHHAALLLRAERPAEAGKSLRSAIDVDPEDYRHHFLLSDVLMRRGRIEEAVIEAEAAARGKDAVPWCFHHLGSLQMRLGRYLEAEASLRRAVDLEAANSRHHFLLSDILARQGHVDEAIIEARTATECANTEPWDFHHLGALLAQTEELQASGAAFERALAMEPDNEQHRRALDEVIRRQAGAQGSGSVGAISS